MPIWTLLIVQHIVSDVINYKNKKAHHAYKHVQPPAHLVPRADVSRRRVSEVMRLWDPKNVPVRHKNLLLLSNEESPPLITCPRLQDQVVHSLTLMYYMKAE